MKLSITLHGKTYSVESQDDEFEGEHISEVIEHFKGLLVNAGYHPSNVDEYFNTEYQWFNNEEPKLTEDQIEELIEVNKDILTKFEDSALEKRVKTLYGDDEKIDPNSIRANTPDWQEGYEQGLLAGYTKSIALTRHLQRTLSVNESISSTTTLFEILEQAMELIGENIETNNNE